MRRGSVLLIVLLTTVLTAARVAQERRAEPSQDRSIRPPENLTTENIPPIPRAIVEKADRYAEFRSATLADWHPTRRELLIGTRLGDVPQVHLVKMPGGARTQLTFFRDRVQGGRYQPKSGGYFIFSSDSGGDEWYQIYRHDLTTGDVTLLTDGKSRNLGAVFEHNGNRFVYSSTRRTGRDTDIWIVDATDPTTDRMLLQLQGGGWSPMDWSPDGTRLLVRESRSANQSQLWMVDVADGAKKPLTATADGEIAYGRGLFARDGKGFYITTDRDAEFMRLAYFDLATMQPAYLTSEIKWDVEEFDLCADGGTIAFSTDEDGISRLHLLDTVSRKTRTVDVPEGIVDRLRFHDNGRDLGFTLSSATSPSDVFSLDVPSGKLERWTHSETGGLNTAGFVAPKLVKWPTFDGRAISGFLYQPDPRRFPGRRPVIVDIHGGPEGQSRPGFRGRSNYFLNELGIALIFPNVRGSTGYGKTFLKLDNGFHRDDTYKDIGALLDWIKQNPDLDAGKIMVTGGSYGGHMTYAVATMFNDRICCSLPVVGITNLVSLLEHTESYRRDLRRVEYGDEREPKMRQYLETIAPYNNWEHIKKPLFAVVGKNDPRVPYTESRQLLDRMKNTGVATWFLSASDEGHGYVKKKNQDFQFYATVMFVRRFLLGEQSLGASSTP